MNKRNLFVRITAIFLCALMLLSVITAALYAFAAEASAVSAPPDTGSSDATVWVMIAVAVALVVIAGCIFAPKFRKR
ncbi:MAG: hypothetical protein E7547_08100 [Ruminococcaceae bacterium]|nr:hypothetical protein [Oscillospiraceae bacterium]